MKTKLSIYIVTLLLSASNLFARARLEGSDPEKDEIIVYVLNNILSRYHYVKKQLDADFS